MKKQWFFDRYCGQNLVALIEDGKVVEFATEPEEDGEVVGNVYKGRVMNVVAGMNAAFVSCGLQKNCYLPLDEEYDGDGRYEGSGDTRATLSHLKAGDEIIVQVTKEPRGSKGAKVTTHLSFVGKRLIYLPSTDFFGISQKIVDESDRTELLKAAEKLRKKGTREGFIMRTKSLGADFKQLKKEAEYLRKLFSETEKHAKNATCGELLYKNDDLPIRVMRDSIGEEIESMHVGDKELFERLLKLAKLRDDFPQKKLVLYSGNRSLFKIHGISQLVYDATKPVVPLEGGGTLVIDHTEAMTVIDVNSGSHVGESNLEETAFAVNRIAAKEIARQVRLRNIGGIVVVDFIDMLSEDHKAEVTRDLTELLALDKAKCHVLPMSELCLTQFTRKRLGSELTKSLIKACPHCHGNGSVHSDIFLTMQIRDALLDCFADGYQAAIVDLNDGMMRKILEEGTYSKEMKGRWRGKQIYLIPHKTYKEHCFRVHGEHTKILTLPDNAQILY
ncbi:MAG: Rne/Rng family ribonuclease [Clostridia bacterium]|nr:Rne/Rng family ribonuclease [Clostridia bacterium]